MFEDSGALNRRSIELERCCAKGWNGRSRANFALGGGKQRQREARVLVDPLLAS